MSIAPSVGALAHPLSVVAGHTGCGELESIVCFLTRAFGGVVVARASLSAA